MQNPVPLRSNAWRLATAGATACLPHLALAAAWHYDGHYGAATVVALPGGQVTLARDGADLQARTITYVQHDGSATTITRDYGPAARKAVESENGATRHHVYGAGLAPIMRTERDGELLYQLGPDTIVVPGAGAPTVARRVTDLKLSTIAVLDSQARSRQRVSYASFGGMRPERAGADPYTAAALLAGYEGLTAWQLGSDQLVDNRARLYDPVSARFLALDRAGQATAYEARANNPVSRGDVDGNVNFEYLINTLRTDRSVRIAFGDDHDSLGAVFGMVYLGLRLMEEGIPFRVFQEASLLTVGPAANKILKRRFGGTGMEEQMMYLLNKGLIVDLDTGYTVMTGEDEAYIRAHYAPRDMKAGYGLFLTGFSQWEQNIPKYLAAMDEKKTVSIFLFGANHLQSFDSTYHDYPPVIYKNHLLIEDLGNAYLIPLSSYGLQSKFNLVSVMHTDLASVFMQKTQVFSSTEILLRNELLSFSYQVLIADQVFANHPTLKEQYKEEMYRRFCHVMNNCMPKFDLPSANGKGDKEEKDEHDEKNGDAESAQHKPVSTQGMLKQGKGLFSDPKFHEK